MEKNMDVFDSLGKVPSFETCKALNWQKQTEKAWVSYQEDSVWFYKLISTASFGYGGYEYHTDILNFSNEKGETFAGNESDFTITPAPDFVEIWETLPVGFYDENQFWLNLQMDFDCIGYYNSYPAKSGWELFEKNTTLTQAAADLYLKLKKENILQ